jgi:hypothetical protein
MRSILAVALLSAPVFSQAPPGAASVSGTVQDPQGVAIAGAKVILTETSRKLVRESWSDRLGAFVFPSVRAGAYTVEVSKEGFTTYRLEEVRLAVGQRAVIDIRLSVGEIRTSMTVTARDAAVLDAESNVIGTVVDAERVQQLPLNGRNFLQLALLSGGASELAPIADIYAINVGHPGRTVVLPGTLPYSVSYSINGIHVRGSRDGELALNLSVAAIDQFKVQQNFFLPDQGPNAAVVNLTTKGGTNDFRGEVFEFLRNQAFDARSFFAVAPENLKRNQFGGAVGGPVLRNRVWFHAFYEGLREITALSQAGYSPTKAMFDGDFGETGRSIYDPAGFDEATGVRPPFPGAVIPASRVNPVAKNLAAYYRPGSSLRSVPNNVYGNPRNTLSDNHFGGRVDASWNPRHHLFGQFFSQDSPAVQEGFYPLSGLFFPSRTALAMAEHTWSVSSRAVNSLRAGFVRAIATGGNEASDKGPLLKQIGIFHTFDDRGIGGVTLTGYSPFGRSNGDVGNADNTWQIDDDFHFIAGNHTLTAGAGGSYRRGWHENANSRALGQLIFNPRFTAQLARNAQGLYLPQSGTGDSWADFLLGLPTSSLLSGLRVTPYRGVEFYPYVQDTWKIAPTLTLNYGVGWHLETPPDPQGGARGTVHGFDPATGLFTYAALGQIAPQVMALDRNNIAPRLGLAWKPAKLRGMVVRAGAGVYYSEFPWIVSQFSLIVTPPFSAGNAFANPTGAPMPAYVLGSNVYPPGSSQTVDSGYASSLPPGTLGSSINPGFRTAYISQWNVSVQQSIGGRNFLEVSYLGSSGHRLPNFNDISQCRPGPDLYCSAAAKPWPRYDELVWIDSDANSSYEGLIAKFRHRTTRSLNLNVEYTAAKAIANGFQSNTVVYGQIATCRRCDKGPATFDVRQRVVGSAVWELPFGKGRRVGGSISPVFDAPLGGWVLTAISTFAAGPPVLLTAPAGAAGLYLTQLPNRICDGRRNIGGSNPRTNGMMWFDPACFPQAAAGYFGNSGRTVIGGPGVNNWDVGLEKIFPLAEHQPLRLMLRLEAFNAWNHTQFQPPNGDAGAGANFGRISASRPPRLIQVGAKLLW